MTTGKIDHLFSYLLVPLDAVMILLGFVVAYKTRAGSIPLPVIYLWPFDQYLKLAFELLPIWLVAFAFAGLYYPQRRSLTELGHIIVGTSLGVMSLIIWVFFNRSDFFSRLIVFYIWIYSIIFVALGRALLTLLKSNLYLFGYKRKSVAIIGSPDGIVYSLISQLKNKPSLGYAVYGIIAKDKPKQESLNWLGHPKDLARIVKENPIDEVILADTEISNEDMFHYMRTCQEDNVTFKAVPAHAQVSARTLQFDAFAGIPIIEFKGTALESWGAVYKRIADAVGSAIALIVFSPLMLIIAIAIKLDSRGPVIYKNERVGNRCNFKTLKFRTMRIEDCTGEEYGGQRAEKYEKKLIEKKNIKTGAVYKIADDPRVTRVGKFLRKTSLDELPQFVNVFFGNMSLVGPRPHQPREVKNYTSEQRKLLLIRPGITGLAQISGRSDLTFDDEARLDITYLENWSIWVDLSIVLRTFGVVIFGRGSY